MQRRAIGLISACSIFILSSAYARAGMPSIGLTEAGQLGTEGISFFLVGLLLSAGGVRLLWNWLARDFARLPRLSYPQACAVVTLWGLLFVLVLTMISGARELMTPGAWQKNGVTYRLTDDAAPRDPATLVPAIPSDDQHLTAERRASLTALSRHLQEYAAQHDGRFPASIEESGLPSKSWHLPRYAGLAYKYVPGSKVDAGSAVVAYEPNVYDDRPLVLLTDGRVVAMDVDALMSLAPAERVP